MGEPITGEKSPVVALILNLCFGFLGIGYFYLGQWQKGLVAILAFWILSVTGVGSLLVWIAAIIDAFMQAKVLQEGRPIGQWTFFTMEQK